MKCVIPILSVVVIVVASLATTAQVKATTPIVVADTLADPPAFMTNSFWGITSAIDRAYSFSVPVGRDVTITKLETVAFHYLGLAGNSAIFSLHLDAAGLPGTELVSFSTNSITTTEQVLNLTPSHEQVLEAGVRHWIVGRTPAGQVNWSLGWNTFGEAAYYNAGSWTVVPRGNISAYRLWGTVVPEPGTIALLAIAVIGIPRSLGGRNHRVRQSYIA